MTLEVLARLDEPFWRPPYPVRAAYRKLKGIQKDQAREELASRLAAAAGLVADVGQLGTEDVLRALARIWDEHPASGVRVAAGWQLLRAGKRHVDVLARAFEPSFAESLDPDLLEGALLEYEQTTQRAWWLAVAREQMWSIATAAALLETADEAMARLGPLVGDEATTATEGWAFDRARAVLRTLLAQQGQSSASGVRNGGWWNEHFPVSGLPDRYAPGWLPLWAAALGRTKFVELAAQLLARAEDPRADEILLERIAAGKTRPHLVHVARAAGARKLTAAGPLLVGLLGGKVDSGDIQAIIDALDAIADHRLVGPLRDVLGREGIHWFAVEKVPALIARLERLDRGLTSRLKESAGRLLQSMTGRRRSAIGPGAPASQPAPAERTPDLPPPDLPDEGAAGVVGAAWDRIEAWLAEHAPHLVSALGDPATVDQIDRAERSLGMRFPAEFRASLTRHDGEKLFAGLTFGFHLNRLDEMVDDWSTMEALRRRGTFRELEDEEPAEGLRPGHWNRGWVAIASDGGGNSFSMDLDPPAGRTLGQVLFFDHEVGAEAGVKATSFAAWLVDVARSFESGEIVMTEDGYPRPAEWDEA